jgi:hypothetical protein
MMMTFDVHVNEMIPAFALDCLNNEEKRLVSEHLASSKPTIGLWLISIWQFLSWSRPRT